MRASPTFLRSAKLAFRYDAPAGWREVRRSFGSTWFDPSSTASLHVGLAVPRRSELPDEILGGMLGGAMKLPVISEHGLYGLRWRSSVANLDSEVVIVEDDQFTYCARLDVGDAANIADDILTALVDSIRPIPREEPLSSRRGALPAR